MNEREYANRFISAKIASEQLKVIIGKNKTEYIVPREFSQDFYGGVLYVLGQLQDQINGWCFKKYAS